MLTGKYNTVPVYKRGALTKPLTPMTCHSDVSALQNDGKTNQRPTEGWGKQTISTNMDSD